MLQRRDSCQENDGSVSLGVQILTCRERRLDPRRIERDAPLDREGGGTMVGCALGAGMMRDHGADDDEGGIGCVSAAAFA